VAVALETGVSVKEAVAVALGERPPVGVAVTVAVAVGEGTTVSAGGRSSTLMLRKLHGR
jgi:hypothetical protein